jgi:tRNA threonylcarbamoyladenosine biosynthesis protein TsaE
MSDADIELTVTTSSAKATESWATTLAARVVSEGRVPLVLLLEGDLGAGKTTFARGFVRGLQGGADVVVQSPTFALARTYPTAPPVHHLDLYRLHDTGSPDSVVELGLVDQCAEGLSLVEWPIAGTVWAAPVGRVQMTTLSPRRRRLHVTLPSASSTTAAVR